MDKGKMVKRTVSGILVGGLLLSGSIAFADDSSNGLTKDFAGGFKAGYKGDRIGSFDGGGFERGGFGGLQGETGRGPGNNLSQESLAALVSDGILTQEKADAVKGYIDTLAEAREAKAEERKAQMEELKSLTPEERKTQREEGKNGIKIDFKERKDLYTELVDNSILTQAEADAVKDYLKDKADAAEREKITNNLNDLVSKGVITQEQADQITAKHEAVREEQKTRQEQIKAEFDKLKDMTEEERKAYFEANKDKAQKPYDFETQLVEAGIITQEQADAIKENARQKAEQDQQQRLNDRLSVLVEKGTLTQAQSDKIAAALEAAKAEQKANMDKLKDMSGEQREEYLQSIKENKEARVQLKGVKANPLSQLVQNGTITQEQADALDGLNLRR